MTKALTEFIDTSRWIAALTVVLLHAGDTFVNQHDIMSAPHGPLAYVWWFFCVYAFAHEAVVVFFVLSGFLVGGAVLARLGQETPWLRNYFIDRTARIYIVLLPVLAIGVLLDTAGRRVFAGLGVYESSFLNGLFDPSLLLPNLLSLQGIWSPPYGSNLALWSLGIEYWYYIVFPLALLIFARAYPRHRTRVFALALALIFLFCVPTASYFLFGFCIWIFGALMRIAPRPLMRSRWLALALFVIASVLCRLLVRGALLDQPWVAHAVDGAEALCFANLLLTLRFDEGAGFAFCRARFHSRLAGFSYTLYALHVPVIMWIWALTELAFGHDWRLQLATPLHYAVAIAAILFVEAAAFGLSRLTEANTGTVRRAVKGIFGKESAKGS